MIPERENYITLTPTREGLFEGKCAELCGEYHSEMLFNVAVVSEEEYEAHLETLADGQLGEEYDRNPQTVTGESPSGADEQIGQD